MPTSAARGLLISDLNETALLSCAILQHLYIYLPLLGDLLVLRGMNNIARQVGTKIVIERFGHILEPFVHGHVAALRHAMHTNIAVITGSCAMAMMTGEVPLTNNLNSLVVHGGSNCFHTFIIETLQYRRVQHNRSPNYAFDGMCTSFAIFRQGNKYITVSEAGVEGLFKLVLSAHTTADMLFMTPGGLTLYYPSWTQQGITLANHTLVLQATGQRLGCMKHGEFQLHTNTAFLSHTCGDDCPTLWRKIADEGTHSLVLVWDIRFGMKDLIRHSNSIWRLALHCDNTYCVHHTSEDQTAVTLPPEPMPADLKTIESQATLIRARVPAYRPGIVGLLYPTRGSKGRLVPIPLRDGNRRPIHVLDLEILYWVDQLGPDPHYSATGRFRKTYNVKQDDLGTPHNFAYTFLREHPLSYPPPNEVVRTVVKGGTDAPDVAGNVLVIKRVRRHHGLIVDCTTDDVFWTNHIMQRYIHPERQHSDGTSQSQISQKAVNIRGTRIMQSGIAGQQFSQGHALHADSVHCRIVHETTAENLILEYAHLGQRGTEVHHSLHDRLGIGRVSRTTPHK
ncbi:hypothetical protein C8R48DRAFT_669001 [Suillus tomentosus]|nr:hypothetical protein C8R48DRAFT_669001 [Suillus tomentosus]